MKRTIPLLVATLAIAACGKAPADGFQTRTIATNLDQEGSTEATYLYWVEADVVKQGRCTSTPEIVANCQADLKSLPLAAFTGALSSNLLGSIDSLTKKIAELETRMPIVAGDIAELSIQLNAADESLTARTSELTVIEEDLVTIQKNVDALNAQITALNAEISANPNNNDLKMLRSERQTQLAAEVNKKSVTESKKNAAATAKLAALSARDALKLKLASATFEFSAKKAELAASRTSLTTAEAERASFEETITRLKNEVIVYDVKANQTIFSSIRSFVARFKFVFDSGALFTAAQVYSELDLSIPTTGSSGTIDFPMDVAVAGQMQDISIQYKMTHASPSDLRITLIAPNGGSVQLRSGSSAALDEYLSVDGRSEAGFASRTASLNQLTTGTSKGVWKLRISDESSFGGAGKLKFVKLMLKMKVTP